MSEHSLDAATGAPWVALLGNPNCGKTALFNLLTGSRQKIANYAGVTVERKEGRLVHVQNPVRVLDLPGVYSLKARTPDEAVTCEYILGLLPDEPRPALVVVVVDATQLARQLRLLIQIRALGYRVVVALNMLDAAQARGIHIDLDAMSAALGVPVVASCGIRGDGAVALTAAIEALVGNVSDPTGRTPVARTAEPIFPTTEAAQHEVDALLRRLGLVSLPEDTWSERLDAIVLHPWLGPLVLAVILFLIFQAVFSWAQPVMTMIAGVVSIAGEICIHWLPEGMFRSLLVDGVLAGTGTVLVFLPQIVILFAFILLLEDSGYLPRAAFLLDRLMGGVGLSGRSFIPLLSSFACAIPGVMATRTIPNPRDRLVTILIAPLMTCSARLPVYALLIGAFVRPRSVGLGIGLQGLCLFVLYAAGVVSAFLVAWTLKRFRRIDALQSLQMELPSYHWPSLRNLVIGLRQRVEIFLSRVGSIILALMVLMWFLSSYPVPPPYFTGPPIEWSVAGRIGLALAHLFAPLGFNWQISVALVPGLAAREVAVGALGTVYALGAEGHDVSARLATLIQGSWSLPTALSLLAWYVFAPQCLSTLAVVRRETNSWSVPAVMAGYQFALAYLAAWMTYHVALRVVGAA